MRRVDDADARVLSASVPANLACDYPCPRLHVLRNQIVGSRCNTAGLRSAIGRRRPHQDIVRIGLWRIRSRCRRNVVSKTSVFQISNSGSSFVHVPHFARQFIVGKSRLRIAIDHPTGSCGMGSSRCSNRLLHIFTVVSLRILSRRNALLKSDRARSKKRSETKLLFEIANPADAVFVPAIARERA